MKALKALSLGDCQRIDVNNLAAVSTAPFDHPAQVLVTSDVNVHVALDDVATTDALMVPTTARPPLVLNLAAGQTISLLGVDVGSVWLAEVR